MWNYTAAHLRALAKQRGIKRCTGLRKAELIQRLESHPVIN